MNESLLKNEKLNIVFSTSLNDIEWKKWKWKQSLILLT